MALARARLAVWVHVSKIAKTERLPESLLAWFALKNQLKYGVILDSKGPKVEASRGETLVEDFRKAEAAKST